MIYFKKSCLLIAAWLGLAAIPGCSFFTGPDEAKNLGELEINIRFAANSPAATGNAVAALRNGGSAPQGGAFFKEGSTLAPEAVDRIVVTILQFAEDQFPNRTPIERQVLRREFRPGADRKVQAVFEVPLENPEYNCFIVRVQALDGQTSLYSGEDFPCFELQNRRAAANILLEPVAFRLQLSNDIPPVNSRFFTLNGQADTTITQIQIVMADSVMVTFPVLGQTFSNPVMLFGNSSVVKVSAFSGKNFRGETSRRVTYTGRRADVLIVLVWNEPVDLDLEVQNPLQQIISVITPGDSVGGNGLLQINDKDGYGPEVYEWRQSSRIPSGPFAVRVVRPRVGLPVATGKVYMLFRESQTQQSIRSFTFAFGPQETTLFKDIPGFTWPVP